MSELTLQLTEAPVKFTNGALNEIKTLMYEKDIPADHGLRIGVEGGGCSGLSYILGFDAKKDGDDEYEIDGVKIYMNRAHGLYLLGMEVDYLNNLNNRGFVFNNPNATATCGCGSSFSA
ncbi:iron-sulfur cluster assembly accessory protein [Sphingobacteriales bacterium UPWRP_1]|nr:iron-sulfur cluster assembly accessory protein [Sphingobacteriales bacterium TSM_CSS]PSJ71850.1 iron-sulfur cluster assembly accessory protein [Sphingobacteriales bacterium UPWRP_1]